MKIVVAVVCILLGLGRAAFADIQVIFVESAPKDRFTVVNAGACKLDDLVVNIDLSNSAGKLIFDTTATGAGVEVFQPFEVGQGNIQLLAASNVSDGDNRLSIGISTLQAGESASFTIDVDDTLPNSALGKIRVAGSEIQNGIVEVLVGDKPASKGAFDDQSAAMVFLTPCGA